MGKTIIIAMIMGLVTVGMVFSFVTNISSEANIDWEQCRQSLVARNLLPEKDLAVIVALSKSFLPLECTTKVIEIDYEDVERAEKEIAETISSCWYMYGRGDYKIFPGRQALTNAETPCMVCARVHLNSDVKEYYSGEDTTIDIERAIDGQLEGYDTTIWDYLNPDRGPRAFMYFKDWSEDGFNITYVERPSFLEDYKDVQDDSEAFSFPKNLISGKGDLFIVYAEPTTESSFDEGRGAKPYMVLLQYDDFDKLSESWIEYGAFFKSKVCSSIETVPS